MYTKRARVKPEVDVWNLKMFAIISICLDAEERTKSSGRRIRTSAGQGKVVGQFPVA